MPELASQLRTQLEQLTEIELLPAERTEARAIVSEIIGTKGMISLDGEWSS